MKTIDNDNKITTNTFFGTLVMEVQLDFDLEKLTELTFQLQNKDKKGIQASNIDGWQSNDIAEEKHEEFIKLKEEMAHYVNLYHSKAFQGMVFEKNVSQSIANMWVNNNGKHQYNDWHVHPSATLSGAYYIKHDGVENGNIEFKNPNFPQTQLQAHWGIGSSYNLNIIKTSNAMTAGIVSITPKPNQLLIFPAWLEHRVKPNLNDNSRISLSFNSIIIVK
jgi:uncharacterized protein (TIGR02466 family)|tara:strand:+ start:39 stop:698 length:660 start_codon:yes stop_codon:yes gene_type:complete